MVKVYQDSKPGQMDEIGMPNQQVIPMFSPPNKFNKWD